MRALEILCMSVTPMKDDYTLDEPAFRAHLRRLVAARNGVYVGSPGAGEGHAHGAKELRRIYEIGVEEARGKVPVYADPPESRTAEAMLAVAREAVAAGIEMVQLSQLDGGHGLIPTVREQEAYFTYLCDRLDHPLSLCMHGPDGYLAPPSLLRRLTDRYPQIKAINVMGPPDRYFQQLRDALPATIRLYTGIGLLPTLAHLGAAGALQNEGNCIPNVCRRIGDAIAAGDRETLATSLTALRRFANIVADRVPGGGAARAAKMAMKALGLGNGVLRPPFLPIADDEVAKITGAFDELRIADIEGLRQRVAA